MDCSPEKQQGRDSVWGAKPDVLHMFLFVVGTPSDSVCSRGVGKYISSVSILACDSSRRAVKELISCSDTKVQEGRAVSKKCTGRGGWFVSRAKIWARLKGVDCE